MEESAKAFDEMLESSKRPLHEHTELCQLDAISQVMALKAQFNMLMGSALLQRPPLPTQHRHDAH